MVDLEELPYYLAFSWFIGIGPMYFNTLLRYFGSAKAAYTAPDKTLKDILKIHLRDKFIVFRRRFDPEKQLRILKQQNIWVLHRPHPLYPQKLNEIQDPPICLFGRGNKEVFKDIASHSVAMCIAVVGTRKPTSYGLYITKRFTTELSRAGFIIVSGMAYGIDSTAHKITLNEGGKTIAVLGCGIDLIYPPGNILLYKSIIEKGSVVISEFPPGRSVLKGLFISRNRIISGLSCGICVIEGTNKSGSLITAKYAAEQGRDVFVPPVPLTSEMSQAPSILIKQGAIFISSVQDILDEYHMKINPAQYNRAIAKSNSKDELKVFEIITKEPSSIDKIASITNQQVSKVMQIITSLELKGYIEKNHEGIYQVKNT